MYNVVLKQSSGPTPSDSLEERLGKAKSSDVAPSIPEYSSKLSKLHLIHTKWKRTKKYNCWALFSRVIELIACFLSHLF